MDEVALPTLAMGGWITWLVDAFTRDARRGCQLFERQIQCFLRLESNRPETGVMPEKKAYAC